MWVIGPRRLQAQGRSEPHALPLVSVPSQSCSVERWSLLAGAPVLVEKVEDRTLALQHLAPEPDPSLHTRYLGRQGPCVASGSECSGGVHRHQGPGLLSVARRQLLALPPHFHCTQECHLSACPKNEALCLTSLISRATVAQVRHGTSPRAPSQLLP